MTMGAIWNLVKAIVLAKRIPKQKLIELLDAMDADRDGYISVKEAVTYVSGIYTVYGKDSNNE